MKKTDITTVLNDVLVGLFRNITSIEEKALKAGNYKDLTVNDMHVIEMIDVHEPKNMTSVARKLMVTTGTLTISVNGLVKKGYVERTRSEEDRRVVLISLTDKGRKAFAQHESFHESMIDSVLTGLEKEEQEVLEKALLNLSGFFNDWAQR
ncbi:MarR family transcriptional regulator [Lachnospiraceae bacterium OttesenSCG-928-D06]|nr:MarR family transcriptional regulator [Lachnospiraceae bacterium OttesenSCG-928-D06]